MTQPNKYANGKIYKVVCNITAEVYIGSTKQRLSQRLYAHKHLKQSTRCREIIKRGDFNIVLIEEYPCENRMQLEKQERFHIDQNECVNKNRPARTPEDAKQWHLDYYSQNQQKINNYTKAYQLQNPDKVNVKQPCDKCNKLLQKTYIQKHQSSGACKNMN